MKRGELVPLTAEQRVARWRYLAGELSLSALDEHVRKDESEIIALGGYPITPTFDPSRLFAPTIYYLLKAHNGGKDPRAPDPATRWRKPATPDEPRPQLNRTCDCSGGNAWACGFDRYQPERFKHVYEGWLNTDSKIIEARMSDAAIAAKGGSRCFQRVDVPTPGAIIVCESGTPGHAVGHEGGIVGYRGAEWDPRERSCWDLIDVVDVAARPARANKRTTGRGWFGTGAMFLVPIMQP